MFDSDLKISGVDPELCEAMRAEWQRQEDHVELIACENYASVQPRSGLQANVSVYMAMLQPGNTILDMSLAHGGQLTQGATVNFSGKIYKSVSYGLEPETDTLGTSCCRGAARPQGRLPADVCYRLPGLYGLPARGSTSSFRAVRSGQRMSAQGRALLTGSVFAKA